MLEVVVGTENKTSANNNYNSDYNFLK